MKNDFNHVMVSGTVISSPTVSFTHGGARVVSVRIRINNESKDKKNGVIRQFYSIVQLHFFNSLAETAYPLLENGVELYVDGCLLSRGCDESYGNVKVQTGVVVKRFHVANSSNSNFDENHEADSDLARRSI